MVHRLTNSAAAEMIDRCARCKSSSHLKKSLPLLFHPPSTIFPKGFEDVGANILTKNVHTAVRCTYDCVYRICCYNYGHAQVKYCESMAHLDRCIENVSATTSFEIAAPCSKAPCTCSRLAMFSRLDLQTSLTCRFVVQFIKANMLPAELPRVC